MPMKTNDNAIAAPVASRSVLRRQALQAGKPMPTFLPRVCEHCGDALPEEATELDTTCSRECSLALTGAL